jgi:hypothetical protein
VPFFSWTGCVCTCPTIFPIPSNASSMHSRFQSTYWPCRQPIECRTHETSTLGKYRKANVMPLHCRTSHGHQVLSRPIVVVPSRRRGCLDERPRASRPAATAPVAAVAASAQLLLAPPRRPDAVDENPQHWYRCRHDGDGCLSLGPYDEGDAII